MTIRQDNVPLTKLRDDPTEDAIWKRWLAGLSRTLTAATGDVIGPASSTDNAITRFNGTTGKSIQNSGVIVDDDNNITQPQGTSASTQNWLMLNNINFNVATDNPVGVDKGLYWSDVTASGGDPSLGAVYRERSSGDLMLVSQSVTRIRAGGGSPERLRVDSDGNVYIGTANNVAGPRVFSVDNTNADAAAYVQSKVSTNAGVLAFQMHSSAAGGGCFIYGAGTDGIHIFTNSATPLKFGVNSGENMRLTSGGKLAINTSTATGGNPLVVAEATGIGQIRALHSTGNGLLLGQLSASGAAYLVNQDNASLILGANNTAHVTIAAGGSVGFGSAISIGADREISVNAPTTASLNFGVASALTGYLASTTTSLNLIAYGATPVLILGTNNTERMRITAAGILDVGGTSGGIAGERLVVEGANSAAHRSARINNTGTSNGYSTLWLGADNDGLIRGGSSAASYASELALVTSGAIPVSIYTNATERMRIDSSGNVGINQPSPTSVANTTFLHIGKGDTTTHNNAGVLRLQSGNAAGGQRSFDTYVGNGGYNYTIRDSAATGYGIQVAFNNGGASAGALSPLTTDTADLGVDAGPRWRNAFVSGVNFPDTQIASADANTLDDYEEGTATVTLRGATSDPTTPVTTTAKYTKIGRLVHFDYYFPSVTTTGAAGAVSVTGLPFTVGQDATGALMSYITLVFAEQAVAYITATGVYYYYMSSAAAWVVAVHSPGVGRYLLQSGTYQI